MKRQKQLMNALKREKGREQPRANYLRKLARQLMDAEEAELDFLGSRDDDPHSEDQHRAGQRHGDWRRDGEE